MLTNNSNAARVLTIAILIWLMAFFYCRTNFYRDPGSAFFDRSRAYTRDYSTYREEQSVSFFKGASEHIPKAAESPSLCAVFMSVKRTGEQPLDVSINSKPSSIYLATRNGDHQDFLS
jgi:hypothetical protein